jgi:hypothetical protein
MCIYWFWGRWINHLKNKMRLFDVGKTYMYYILKRRDSDDPTRNLECKLWEMQLYLPHVRAVHPFEIQKWTNIFSCISIMGYTNNAWKLHSQNDILSPLAPHVFHWILMLVYSLSSKSYVWFTPIAYLCPKWRGLWKKYQFWIYSNNLSWSSVH